MLLFWDNLVCLISLHFKSWTLSSAVQTSVVRLSTSKPNLWIPIIDFISFLGKEGYVSPKKNQSTTVAGYK